jgi:hypothetical protein
VSLLDGQIAAVFNRAFYSTYLPATLVHRELTYDEGGSPLPPSDTQHSCRAQIDVANDAMRQAPVYTERTVRVLVLKDTLDVEPSTNDVVQCRGQSFNISSVGTDPANSYWDMAAERA